MEYLKIRNWDKWQTYRNDRGQPPWIKVHRRIRMNPEWVELSDCERGQLVAIWLLAADKEGAIPASSEMIKKLCFMQKPPDLNKFMDLGFIEDGWRRNDAGTTPERQPNDHPKAEAEAEEDNTAFPKKAGDAEPFYLTKKKKKLTGWRFKTFKLFWKAFNWPKDKAAAADAWLEIPGLTQELVVEKIIPAAKHEAEARQGLLQTGHSPKWAQGWLSSRRWEDELPSRIKESGMKCSKCKSVVSPLISGLCLKCKEKEDLQ